MFFIISLETVKYFFHIRMFRFKCCGRFVIPFLKINVALPVFMKCGSGQHKLTVCATKERYIIRNGISRPCCVFGLKKCFNRPIQKRLILLDRLHIVATSIHDLFAESTLRQKRVRCYDFTTHVKGFKVMDRCRTGCFLMCPTAGFCECRLRSCPSCDGCLAVMSAHQTDNHKCKDGYQRVSLAFIVARVWNFC